MDVSIEKLYWNLEVGCFLGLFLACSWMIKPIILFPLVLAFFHGWIKVNNWWKFSELKENKYDSNFIKFMSSLFNARRWTILFWSTTYFLVYNQLCGLWWSINDLLMIILHILMYTFLLNWQWHFLWLAWWLCFGLRFNNWDRKKNWSLEMYPWFNFQILLEETDVIHFKFEAS